jgi:hypothetical protein
VFAIHDSVPHILRSVRMTTHSTSLVIHARDHWRTLDFANAFVSPGVNSLAELVPSPRAYARNGAPRRWLGDEDGKFTFMNGMNYHLSLQSYYQPQVHAIFSFVLKQFRGHFLDELYITDRYFMTKMMYLFETRYFQAALTEIVLCVMNFHPFLLQDSSESNQRLGKLRSAWELSFMVVLKVRGGKYPHSNILKLSGKITLQKIMCKFTQKYR